MKFKTSILTFVLWLVIFTLGSVLAFPYMAPDLLPRVPPIIAHLFGWDRFLDKEPTIRLGADGEEYFNEEMPQAEKKKATSLGAAIPSVVYRTDGKAYIQIRNTGQQSIVPSCTVAGREVYRASRALNQSEKVIALITVPETADKVVTLVEGTGDGGKFTITSKVIEK